MAETTKIYANTIASYNEGKLLSEDKLRRLAEADFTDAVKMLCDYGYGEGVVDSESYDVDKFITAETARLIDFVKDDCPSDFTAAVLLARFHYNNAKAFYKARFIDKNVLGAAFVMDDDFTADILNGDYSGCPQAMSDALKSLDEKAAEGGLTSKQIDDALNKAMYGDMLNNAKRAGKSVKRYVKIKIDFVNLTAAVRCLKAGCDLKELEKSFIDGGSISYDDMAAAFNAGLDGFADKLRDTVYYDALKTIGEDGGGLALFESVAENVQSDVFDGNLLDMLSDAPFLNYFFARLSEFKKVKVILTCVKNDARQEIKSRLRWS